MIFTVGLFNESFASTIKSFIEDEDNSTALESIDTPRKKLFSIMKKKNSLKPKKVKKLPLNDQIYFIKNKFNQNQKKRTAKILFLEKRKTMHKNTFNKQCKICN